MPFSHEFEEDVLEPQTATTHEEFGDRARVEKQPVIHHDSVRARLLNLTEQMGGHDHRPARRGVVVHDLAHFANLGWVKAVGGLVKNEEIRHAEHCLGDAETLAHALAVGANLAVDGAAQAGDVQDGLQLGIATLPSTRTPKEIQVLAAG